MLTCRYPRLHVSVNPSSTPPHPAGPDQAHCHPLLPLIGSPPLIMPHLSHYPRLGPPTWINSLSPHSSQIGPATPPLPSPAYFWLPALSQRSRQGRGTHIYIPCHYCCPLGWALPGEEQQPGGSGSSARCSVDVLPFPACSPLTVLAAKGNGG